MSTSNALGDTSIDPSIVKRANAIWRRAGVRRVDRQEMTQELTDELAAAAEAGRAATTVTGDEVAATMREWADERGMSGRAGRYPTLVVATLAGVAAGMGLLIAVLFIAFANNFIIQPYPLIFGIYLVSGALAYMLALAGAWIALTVFDDPRRQETIGSLALFLPVGTVAAIAAGVATAWLRGFTTSVFTFVAVVVVVWGVLAATVVAARSRAIGMQHD